MVVLDSPPHQKIASESPTVHTPKSKRAAHEIEPEKQVLDSPSHGMTGLKAEEPITVGPKTLPDSPFPKRVSPILYHRPGTQYRKVDLPGKEIETLEAGILDKTEDSFEIDSESERTFIEEPKEPKEPEGPKTPKFEINRGETPQGITKRKLAPVVLPFNTVIGKGPKTEIGAKPKILSKLEASIEKKPTVGEKTIAAIEKPIDNPGKGPEKKSGETEKPHKNPIEEAAAAPPAPIVRSPSKTPSASPVSTLSSHISTPPSSPPLSPIVPLVGPVAMGTVEEIKNALIESNRVAAMPIPQFYGKKGEKPEDHIMKVEDYFQNYNIRDQEQKCNRFRDTCCGKARTWLSTLTEYPNIFDP